MFFLLLQLILSYEYKEYYKGSQYFTKLKVMNEISLTFKYTRLIEGFNWSVLYFNKSSEFYFHAIYFPDYQKYIAFRLPKNNDKINFTKCNLLLNSFLGTEGSFLYILKKIYEIHNIPYKNSVFNDPTAYIFELDYDDTKTNKKVRYASGESVNGRKCRITGIHQEIEIAPKSIFLFYAIYLVVINSSWLFYFLNLYNPISTVEMFWDIFMTFGESLFPYFIFLDVNMSTNCYTKYIRFIYIFDILHQQLKQYLIFKNCKEFNNGEEKSTLFYLYYISITALVLFIHYGFISMISRYPLIILMYNSCYLLQVFLYLFFPNDCNFLNQNEFIILNLIGRLVILHCCGRIEGNIFGNYYPNEALFTMFFLGIQATFIVIKNFLPFTKQSL